MTFSVLNYLFSAAAAAILNLDEEIGLEMILFSVALFLAGTVFFGFAAFVSAISARAYPNPLFYPQ